MGNTLESDGFMQVILVSTAIQAKACFRPRQMCVKQVSVKRAVNGSLVLGRLDIKALRQLAFFLEKGMLERDAEGDTSKLIVSCWVKCVVKDGSPTSLSKKYPLTC